MTSAVREEVLELRGVSKSYGSTKALRDVSLHVRRGTIHGLVGENGAGKSTLGKVITGAVRPTSGTILVDGEELSFRSPHDAHKQGVTLIAQELALEPERTVLENVMLGTEDRTAGFVRRGRLRARYSELDASTGFGLEPERCVGTLRLADQQKVEILRALATQPRIMVMDEPTAALTNEAAARMWNVVAALRDQGRTIILISHFLSDVLRMCDDVSVLRDGQLVSSGRADAHTTETLVEQMVGRALSRNVPRRPKVPADAETVLSVSNLSTRLLSDVSIEVRAGEIVGLAGLVGSGRTELARAIFGADRTARGTEIALRGSVTRLSSPRAAIRAGVALIPESRKEGGLVLGRSTAHNVSLPHLANYSRFGLMRRKHERSQVAQALDDVGVRASAAAEPVGSLSGGNQQKALFAKWLCRPPAVLIADEPTRGVDVGAKFAIYELLVAMAGRGMGVLMISSELEEILALANRVVVMRNGAVVGELSDDAEEREVLRLAFGLGPSEQMEANHVTGVDLRPGAAHD